MSFDPEEYTGIAAKAVSKAVQFAQENGNIEVHPLHLAAVLFKENNSLGAQVSPSPTERKLREGR
jgi:hypothetical protein